MTKLFLDDNEFVLPVGIIDESGCLHKTVKLRPMTGETEEAIADPKVRDNGGKIVTELLYSVIESIGTLPKVNRDMIRALTIADRDFLLLMNRKVSIGEEISYVDSCLHCKTKNEVNLNVSNIPVKVLDEKDSKELTFDLPNGYRDASGTVHKTITVSFPSGVVQERVASLVRSNPAQATTLMLTLITKKLGSLDFVNPDIFKSMTKRDRDEISKRVTSIDAGATLNSTVTCSGCGEEFTTYINIQSLMGE